MDMLETIVAMGDESKTETVAADAGTEVDNVEEITTEWEPRIEDTRVINIANATTRNYTYIGRPKRGYVPEGQVDWGNPYSHDPKSNARWIVDSREEAVERYEGWLQKQFLASNITVRDLAGMYGRTLGCFCKPHACHGDKIAKAAAWAVAQLAKPERRSQLVEVAQAYQEEGKPFACAVIGTQTWRDTDTVWNILDELSMHNANLSLVIDQNVESDLYDIVQEWAQLNAVPVIEHKADWDANGKSAGMKRNEAIWNDADGGIAFWDGKSGEVRSNFGMFKAPFALVVDPHACKKLQEEVDEEAMETMAAALLGDAKAFSFDL